MPVRDGCAPLDKSDFEQAPLWVDIKKNPPIADSATKGGWLARRTMSPVNGLSCISFEGFYEPLAFRP